MGESVGLINKAKQFCYAEDVQYDEGTHRIKNIYLCNIVRAGISKSKMAMTHP